MGKKIGVYEAKTHFSKLLNQVGNGQEFTIFRGDEPIAKLIPLYKEKQKRKFGQAQGKFAVTDAFFEPLPDDITHGFNS